MKIHWWIQIHSEGGGGYGSPTRRENERARDIYDSK